MNMIKPAIVTLAVSAAFAIGTVAGPVYAGLSVPYMPNLQFVEDAEVVTKTDSLRPAPCTQLELSAKIHPSECGTYSRAELTRMKAAQDE